MDAIIIEGLKVDTVVGCFNWERQIIQPLMLDLNYPEIKNCIA